jgi:hypothetical protein
VGYLAVYWSGLNGGNSNGVFKLFERGKLHNGLMNKRLVKSARSSLLPAFLVPLLLSVIGCGTSKSPAALESTAAQSPVPVTTVAAGPAPSALTVPALAPTGLVTIAELLEVDADAVAELISGAIGLSMQRCMAERGFEYPLAKFSPRQKISSIPDPALLAQFGYAWRLHAADIASTQTAEIPSYQCGPAAGELLGQADYDASVQVLQSADSELFQQTLGDPRYLAVLQSWSACMSGSGYVYKDLSEPRAQTSSMVPGGDQNPNAILIAQTDYACQEQVGLREVRYETLAELTATWLEDHPQALLDVQNQKAAIVERAKAILES